MSASIAVPRGFRDEVEQAVAERDPGKLGLLGAETEGFPWASEGLRLVGRAEIDLNASLDARATWEEVHARDAGDAEANERLRALDRRLDEHAAPPRARRRVLVFTGHMIDAPGRKA